MKTYMVGGAVRDALLGQPVHDRDWVIVGATPKQLLELGYTPVGKDFPVFLHPHTHEEVALARTERKTAPGYHGFNFYADTNVTLEDDLARRDLTINAMAMDEHGHVIDPYGGQQDLQAKVLRHVTEAFTEDPVRILRIARFAARYPEFRVAPETMSLMQQMVSKGEADALVAERVWQEISRGLMEKKPSRMLAVLHECSALQKILPEVDKRFGQPLWVSACFAGLVESNIDAAVHLQRALDASAELAYALPVRVALLFDFTNGCKDADQVRAPSEQINAICERLRVPAVCRELALLNSEQKNSIHALGQPTPSGHDVFDLFKRSDAFRKPERFCELLQAVYCDALAYGDPLCNAYQQKIELEKMLKALLKLDGKAITAQALAQGKKGPEIGQALDLARCQYTEQVWAQRSQ